MLLGTVAGVIVLFVVAGVIGAATGAGTKNTGDKRPVAAVAHKPKPTPSPTATLTASQQAFVNAVEAAYPNETWNPPALAKVGQDTCNALADGESVPAMRQALRKGGMPAGQPATFINLAAKNICPNALPHTIATFTGNGSENTPQFTAPTNWTLNWSYNCSSMGTSNFIVEEDGGNDATGDGVTVNELGSVQSGSTNAYGDAGTHYL